MSDQWKSAEIDDFTKRYMEAHRNNNERLRQLINTAFYDFLRLHRSTGLSIEKAAEAAVESMNKAMRKPT